jgi:hypothetical protein
MDETLSERLPYASRAVNVLSTIAIYGYHIDLDTTTQRRWHEAMQAMRVTDSYADQPDSQDRFVHLLDFVASFDESFPSLAAEQLGSTRYSKLIRGAATILKYGEQLSLADSPKEYIAIRAAEAQETAEVVTQLATEYVTAQPNYFARFAPNVQRLTTAAGFIDTAIDAKRDFREGTLAFSPSPAFRARLLQKGVAEIAPLAPILARPKIIASFGTLAVQAIKSELLKQS